jgi:(p)ppGpp synthase/HD superfamily hydrolase
VVKDTNLLSSRFSDALAFANKLHAGQVRKGTTIPYVAHLLAVSALVLEAGGDEDEAIAALLHDAVEDQGGLKTLGIIQKRFGERVASIVENCTDAYTDPKPPWRDRKETYLENLSQAPTDVLRVSLADKLHNARSIYRDLQENGVEIFSKFRGGQSGTLWYYYELLEIFSGRVSNTLVDEFAKVVGLIQSIAKDSE